MPGTLLHPRPLPQRTLPLVAAAAVVALALPIFLIAGWRVQGWALGAVLWAGSQGLGWVLQRFGSDTGNLAAAGVVAFGMMFRAVAVMVVVFAVAVSDPWLGVAAALVYALAYTTELALSLVDYFGRPAR
jgi:hypothetical protein